MKSDPYQTLNLSTTADEAEIRRQYLRLVKEHSPEKDPEGFAAIREAYEELRDPVERMKTRLFGIRDDHQLDQIHSELLRRIRTARIPTSKLLELAKLK